jgi:hypothetical protein
MQIPSGPLPAFYPNRTPSFMSRNYLAPRTS